jgi:GNAT superfamily N-acetyltransferase
MVKYERAPRGTADAFTCGNCRGIWRAVESVRSAGCDAHAWSGSQVPFVELTSIGVYKKHQGHRYASRALGMLTALCDENAMTIKLVARSLESDLLLPGCPATLLTEQLVAWYQRHGFVETGAAGDDTREMTRMPR